MQFNNLFCAVLIAASAVIINIDAILEYFCKKSITSSVWCFEGLKNTKLCKFKNICYDPELRTLLFFLNDKSIIKGIGGYKDLQKIQLSSVFSHNRFYANISMIDTAAYGNEKKIIHYQKGFLFSRFKPNNLMHSIHDDLFPLFLTLESACLGDVQCMEDYSLIMFDHYPKGPYFLLYDLFSNHPPLVLSQMETHTNVCFKEMLAGLIQDGIFFQYGFDKPQGPVRTNHLNANDISRFATFIKSKLKIKKATKSEVILISRVKNRRIINVDEVEEMIKSVYQKLKKTIKLNTINLDVAVNVLDIIKATAKADVMIGMHGAEMILSLFMQPDSVVFELFPFAILPDAVSFIKPISESYFSWRNMHRNNSIAHPDAHPLFGGIDHLDLPAQQKIKAISQVQPVKCCNDPAYLYYMYQDTYVSCDFKNFLYASMKELQQSNKTMYNKWFFPYKVSNVNCRFHAEDKQLNITWRPPFNVNSNLEYKLYVKGKTGKFEKEFSTKKPSVLLKVTSDVNKFQVWISAHYEINGSESPDLYVECV